MSLKIPKTATERAALIAGGFALGAAVVSGLFSWALKDRDDSGVEILSLSLSATESNYLRVRCATLDRVPVREIKREAMCFQLGVDAPTPDETKTKRHSPLAKNAADAASAPRLSADKLTPVFDVILQNKAKQPLALVGIELRVREVEESEQGSSSEEPNYSRVLKPATHYRVSLDRCNHRDATTPPKQCFDSTAIEPPLALIKHDPIRFRVELVPAPGESLGVREIHIVFVLSNDEELTSKPLYIEM